VHGNSLRGWGSPATPDPVLLVPRGFDAVNGRFKYDVNPRFADARLLAPHRAEEVDGAVHHPPVAEPLVVRGQRAARSLECSGPESA